VVTGLDYDAAPSHLRRERGILIASNSFLYKLRARSALDIKYFERLRSGDSCASHKRAMKCNPRHDTFTWVKSGFGEFILNHAGGFLTRLLYFDMHTKSCSKYSLTRVGRH
jgi:hypothetical protein